MKKVNSSKVTSGLREIAGQDVYNVWLEMLKELVPGGRTHRLSVIIAGFLRYAVSKLDEAEEYDETSLEFALLASSELDWYDYDDEGNYSEKIIEAIRQMFDDAGVKSERKNARGSRYSIAEDAFDEFVKWYNMPWQE